MMKDSNFYLYGNGGSQNHGCEAITRSTCGIFSHIPFHAITKLPSEDKAYGVDTLCKLISPADVSHPRFTLRFLKAYLALKKGNFVPMDDLPYMDALAQAQKGDIALSAGGDNYCYSNAGAFFLGNCRSFLKKRGVKTVLWGCSVEPDVISGRILKDLKQYHLIVARESISYGALKKVNPNTVLAPDPAFTLPRSPGNYPDRLGNRPYIGINVSPLIQSREAKKGITTDNFRGLISYILQKTDRDIALIPHVVWDHSDDRIPLKQLYEEFADTGRVYLVEDQNCMQLKDIISGCEFFVGARTHATIAAYSTCVPTLVVGYSVKARGIARDLFGSEEGYVLPVQQLKEKDDLVNSFRALYEKRAEIRQHLTNRMLDYIKGMDAAREAVEKL